MPASAAGLKELLTPGSVTANEIGWALIRAAEAALGLTFSTTEGFRLEDHVKLSLTGEDGVRTGERLLVLRRGGVRRSLQSAGTVVADITVPVSSDPAMSSATGVVWDPAQSPVYNVAVRLAAMFSPDPSTSSPDVLAALGSVLQAWGRVTGEDMSTRLTDMTMSIDAGVAGGNSVLAGVLESAVSKGAARSPTPSPHPTQDNRVSPAVFMAAAAGGGGALALILAGTAAWCLCAKKVRCAWCSCSRPAGVGPFRDERKANADSVESKLHGDGERVSRELNSECGSDGLQALEAQDGVVEYVSAVREACEQEGGVEFVHDTRVSVGQEEHTAPAFTAALSATPSPVHFRLASGHSVSRTHASEQQHGGDESHGHASLPGLGLFTGTAVASLTLPPRRGMRDRASAPLVADASQEEEEGAPFGTTRRRGPEASSSVAGGARGRLLSPTAGTAEGDDTASGAFHTAKRGDAVPNGDGRAPGAPVHSVPETGIERTGRPNGVKAAWS